VSVHFAPPCYLEFYTLLAVSFRSCCSLPKKACPITNVVDAVRRNITEKLGDQTNPLQTRP
jgi:hypothetical protein